MPKRLDLSKGEIIAAMQNTKSVRSAARYLGCSYIHLKKWMKFYVDEESGKTLFDMHKNRQGKGIPKFLGKTKKEDAIEDIVAGRIDASSFDPQKLKDKILERDLMEEKCNLCGFSERRVLDFKMPLIMSFKNGDKRNWVLHNLQLLCYNCYFLTIGNVFTDRDMQQLEETKSVSKTTDAVDFQLDDYHLTRLKEIGLYEDPKNDDDPYDLVSYSK